MVHRLAWFFIWVALTPGSARSQEAFPIGEDFQVNTLTATSQDDLAVPGVAALSDDSFVVVWEFESYYAGYANIVRGRRYDSSGDPVGDGFSVSGSEQAYELDPDVAAAEDDSFVVVWSAPESVSYTSIRARRYDSTGTPSGPPYSVSEPVFPEKPAIAAAPAESGGFVVVWQRVGLDGSSSGIGARQLDASGNALGVEMLVNAYTTGAQTRPDVALAPDSSFVVVWRTTETAAAEGRARWFDSSGTALTGDLPLDADAPEVFSWPRVAQHGDRFLIVWDQPGADGDGTGIRARFWDLDGHPVGDAFTVNGHTTGNQGGARVAATGRGDFAVVWSSAPQGGHVGRLLASTGAAIGSEFVVNSDTAGDQLAQAVDGGDSTFVVAWENHNPDETIRGRRFEQALFLDGFESGDTSAW